MSYRSESNNKRAGGANGQPIKAKLQRTKRPDGAAAFLCTLSLSPQTCLAMFAKASKTITIAHTQSFVQTVNLFKYSNSGRKYRSQRPSSSQLTNQIVAVMYMETSLTISLGEM